MKILLIAGGWSSERDVSLAGADNIQTALQELGHQVTFFDLLDGFNSLLAVAASHDFAFINLHGAPGEDGLVQAMLDSIHIPYQGSGPGPSFLALNKAASKQIFRNAGIKTADWELLPKAHPDAMPELTFPIFAKSNTGGSSIRLGKAENMKELLTIIQEIHNANEAALLEPALPGQEITCGILGDTPLPPILIQPIAGQFFDYQSKYIKGGAREICPAPLPAPQTKKVQELALAAHKALGLYGYSRADFILDASGDFTILEINTLPGMTSTSLLPQEAASIGITFNQLISRLVELGLERPR